MSGNEVGLHGIAEPEAAAMKLTWPEGRSPENGYPLCPGCGHDFGQHSPSLSCPTCFNARTPCTVDQAAVFAAIEAARQMPAAVHREPTRPAEIIARAFHETYEYLAPSYDYKTRPESAVDWEDVPDQNRALMTHVVGNLLAEGVIKPGDGASP